MSSQVQVGVALLPLRTCISLTVRSPRFPKDGNDRGNGFGNIEQALKFL